MNTTPRSAFAAVASTGFAIALIGTLTWLVGAESAQLWGWPVVVLAGALALATQWCVWIPSALYRTEKYFDLTGSLTYLVTIGLAFVAGDQGIREALVAAAVWIWACRLGTFLFARIRRDGRTAASTASRSTPSASSWCGISRPSGSR